MKPEAPDPGHELHKSRESVTVLDVVFKEREVRGDNWDVYAVTERGREQIGYVSRAGNWVGSRDLTLFKDGTWGRLFLGVPAGESVRADMADFAAHWNGTSIFVHPTLPPKAEEGEIKHIGGDSYLVTGWLGHSRIWMEQAVEASSKYDSSSTLGLWHQNVAYTMVGFSIELLFKSLAWVAGHEIVTGRGSGHKIRPIVEQLEKVASMEPVLSKLDEAVAAGGWASTSDFVAYVDEYLLPASRRYFGISKDKKFEGLNIRRGVDRIRALASVQSGILSVMPKMLEPPG